MKNIYDNLMEIYVKLMLFVLMSVALCCLPFRRRETNS